MSTRSRRFSRLSSGPPWPTGDSLVCSFEERPIGPRPIPRNILGDTVRLAAPTEEGAELPSHIVGRRLAAREGYWHVPEQFPEQHSKPVWHEAPLLWHA